MYGTVARWRVKDGKQKELEQLSQELMRETPAGSRSVYMYRSDNDPREYWVASQWESREAYTSNSNTPEQDARYRRLRELMESDPEWHDGEIVVAQR
jgi:quinol monooxygenase YgiN